MNKKIIIPLVAAISLFGAASFTALSVLNKATATQKDENTIIAINTDLTKNPIINNSKDETVFVMTDENGSAKTKFIGNTIYSGNEELPFNLKITYFLDGQEISANDLVKKTGHVKIIYNYNSTAYYQSKRIPFLAITGLNLDHEIFSNVKIENGKIINESSKSYVIAGYSLVGFNQNLGTDFLPDSFSIEADAKDFKLGDSYTILTNDVLADLDTSKFTDIDSIVNSINDLSNGLDKILDGATDLSNGLSTALDGIKNLHAGSQTLANGLNELKSHNTELVAGAKQIATMAPEITELLQDKKSSLLEKKASLEERLETIPDLEPYAEIRAQIITGIAQIDAGIEKINLSLSSLPALESFYQGLISYTDGVTKAAEGASILSTGLESLVNGETEIYNGSTNLKEGLNTFKTSGIDKLVNFANKDIANFTRNLRSTINAAASYKNYGNINADTVKFIVKTPSI